MAIIYLEREGANAITLDAQSYEFKDSKDHDIDHMVGDIHIYYRGLTKHKRMIICDEVNFSSLATMETAIHKLEVINKAGTGTLEISFDAGSTFVKFWSNGTSQQSSMEVVYSKGSWKPIGQVGVQWVVEGLTFEQAG